MAKAMFVILQSVSSVKIRFGLLRLVLGVSTIQHPTRSDIVLVLVLELSGPKTEETDAER